jgi:hypothetical protein
MARNRYSISYLSNKTTAIYLLGAFNHSVHTTLVNGGGNNDPPTNNIIVESSLPERHRMIYTYTSMYLQILTNDIYDLHSYTELFWYMHYIG